MNVNIQLTADQLRQAADLKEKIEALQAELEHLLGTDLAAPRTEETPEPANVGKRRFSAKTRAKMAAAQRARWAVKRGEAATPAEKPKTKRQVNEARLKALAKAREARWAKYRAAKATAAAKNKK